MCTWTHLTLAMHMLFSHCAQMFLSDSFISWASMSHARLMQSQHETPSLDTKPHQTSFTISHSGCTAVVLFLSSPQTPYFRHNSCPRWQFMFCMWYFSAQKLIGHITLKPLVTILALSASMFHTLYGPGCHITYNCSQRAIRLKCHYIAISVHMCKCSKFIHNCTCISHPLHWSKLSFTYTKNVNINLHFYSLDSITNNKLDTTDKCTYMSTAIYLHMLQSSQCITIFILIPDEVFPLYLALKHVRSS